VLLVEPVEDVPDVLGVELLPPPPPPPHAARASSAAVAAMVSVKRAVVWFFMSYSVVSIVRERHSHPLITDCRAGDEVKPADVAHFGLSRRRNAE
jgi:hypothetical protein